MHSDDEPPGADDQLPYGEAVPPQPPRQRPSWLIWTIVGGTAALVAIVGVIAIVAVARRGTQDGASNGSANRPVAAVEQLRSRLPADLKSADKCAETAPLSYAASTIECTWPSSHVPRAATYSLFDDSTSMLRSAMTLVRSSGGYGSSCRSAADFNDDGGQMLWERDGRERGTVWCYLNDNDEPIILWTDTAPKILATAIAPARQDAKKLLEWFLTAGQASLEATPAPPPPPPAPTTNSPRNPSPRTSTSTSTNHSPETSTPPSTDPPDDSPSPDSQPRQPSTSTSTSESTPPEESTPPITDPPIDPPTPTDVYPS